MKDDKTKIASIKANINALKKQYLDLNKAMLDDFKKTTEQIKPMKQRIRELEKDLGVEKQKDEEKKGKTLVSKVKLFANKIEKKMNKMLKKENYKVEKKNIKKEKKLKKDPVLQNQAKKKEEGGNQIFDKRYARYVTIQVLEDNNHPELNGKYMFWKMPKAVWDVINAKQSPTNPAKAAIPVMDFLFGRAIDLEVKPGPGKPGEERYSRETSYAAELTDDPVSCVNPDMSPLLNASQQAVLEQYIDDMKKVWKEKDPANENDDPKKTGLLNFVIKR